MTKRYKVLIIDDSSLYRSLLKEILSEDKELEVVGTAYDPYDARDKIKLLKPDVLTLDVEMPKMDGITFLKNLMRLKPMPVVMVSSLTSKNATITLKALEIGAVDFIAKPNESSNTGLLDYADIIIDKVKVAAQTSLHSLLNQHYRHSQKKATSRVSSEYNLIAIGASTGGTEAIKELLLDLPSNMPPIMIVQHIPPTFSTTYAKRLNNMLDMEVIEVQQKQTLKSGHVYIAPGDRHLQLKAKGSQLYGVLDDGPPVNRHCPSVDVLFDSVARVYANHTAAVLLTGMGMDGAAGMKNLNDAGAFTIAQDEKTSIVWGMPKAAIALDAVKEVLPLNQIGKRLIN